MAESAFTKVDKDRVVKMSAFAEKSEGGFQAGENEDGRKTQGVVKAGRWEEVGEISAIMCTFLYFILNFAFFCYY